MLEAAKKKLLDVRKKLTMRASKDEAKKANNKQMEKFNDD